jgi:hypothetical protein
MAEMASEYPQETHLPHYILGIMLGLYRYHPYCIARPFIGFEGLHFVYNLKLIG